MTRLALHPNDASITLIDNQRVRYREPGFALFDDERITTGSGAFRQARISPRRIQHKFWSALSAAAFTDRHFEHLSPADLVSQQLEELWSRHAADGDELVIAVPAHMTRDQLGLLLGIASELGVPVVAMVDAAVAATRREYRNATPVHIDMGLHTTAMARLAQVGHAQVEGTEILEECGLFQLYDTWLNAIAEAFVEGSRFDPLHTAETEQMLVNSLDQWLTEAAAQPTVSLSLDHAGLQHRAEIESLRLIGAAAPFYQRIASQLRALYRAGETPALQVTERVARLPGLADMLKARVGGEVYSLEMAATARGALARLGEVADPGQGGVTLLRQLPWDQSAFEVESAAAQQGDGALPTHLLFRHRAYRLEGRPLVIGTQHAEGDRSLALDGDMPGVSRRHCTLAHVDGRCVVEDSSRYGTYLNGHRISGSTVLQVGDTLRVGSPGFELTLIATEEC